MVAARFLERRLPDAGRARVRHALRALRTGFTERWEARRDELRRDPAVMLAELEAAEEAGTLDELVVVGGQSAGLIEEVLPAADIVETIAAEAAALLAGAPDLVE